MTRSSLTYLTNRWHDPTSARYALTTGRQQDYPAALWDLYFAFFLSRSHRFWEE